MEFQGQEQVDAPRQQVWDFISDPRRYAACTDGAMKNIQIVDDRRFTFEIQVPGQRIKCQGEWQQRDEPSRATMLIKGSAGFFGKAQMTNTVELVELTPNDTQVNWHTNVELSGVLSAVAGSHVGPAIENMNQDVINCIREQIKAS